MDIATGTSPNDPDIFKENIISEEPKPSGAAAFDGKLFDPNVTGANLVDDSKISGEEKSSEAAQISLDGNGAVANALALVQQLKAALKRIPVTSSFKRIELHDQPSTSSTSSVEENSANEIEVERLRKENEEIQKDIKSKQETIMQLSLNYEDATEQLNEKATECARLRATLQQSLSSVDESSLSDVSLSTTGEGFSTVPTSSSEVSNITNLSNPVPGPQSLPVFKPVKMPEIELQQQVRDLEHKAQSYQSTIQKLTDMNAQWEQYNGEKEAIVKRLEESLKERQLEIEHLKRQISSNNRNTITFSPAQQAFIDNAYQRLRLEADRYRDQQEAITLEAQRAVAQTKQKQEEAEKNALKLQNRVEELENNARIHRDRQGELQTALLVATRSSQQTSREQELISSLREAARQYENDLKRVRDDHRIAVREINLLKDELARLRQRGNVVQQTIVSHHPGGTSTLTRSGGNFTIRNEPDIEIDHFNRF